MTGHRPVRISAHIHWSTAITDLQIITAWTTKPIKQDVTYEDQEKLATSLAKLKRLPPLVTPQEVRDSLKRKVF